MKKQYLVFLALVVSFFAFGVIKPFDGFFAVEADTPEIVNDDVDCDEADQCTYTFIMLDDYGDGWNGGSMTIFQDGVEVETIELMDGEEGTVEVALCHDEPFTLFWNTGGAYTYEVGVSIEDPFGEIIFNKPFDTGSPGTELHAGVVNCTAPSCPMPVDIEVDFTQTTAEVSWTEQGDATEWEVIILPAGSGEPEGDEEEIVLTEDNPYTFEDLDSATSYEVYVRAICDTDDMSSWRGPTSFVTLIANDDCDEATEVPVNTDATCALTTPGTFMGATLSAIGGNINCYDWNDAVKDVWFEFEATETAHEVSLLNMAITWNVYLEIFEEADCATTGATPLACGQNTMALSGLTVGDTYKIRVSTYTATNNSTFDVCVRTLNAPDNDDCDEATEVPVNTDATCTLTTPGTLVDATLSTIGGNIECYDWDDAVKDVWFEFEATDTAHKVSLLNMMTTWNVYLEVFEEADCESEDATPLACGQNAITLTDLTVGDTYKIRVSTYTATNNSTFDVCVRTLNAPDNDECGEAVELPVSETMECEESVEGTFVDATLSSDASDGCSDWGDVPEIDVWYEFTAVTTTHGVILSTDADTWNVYIEVYEEDICDGFVDPIACGQTTELVVNDLTPGDTYKVRFFSVNGQDQFDFEACVITLYPPIRVADDEHTVPELVEDVLIGDTGGCTNVDNIDWITGTDFIGQWTGQPGPNGIAYFEKNGSLFPFENGIVLSTGRALDAEGPSSEPMESGDTAWEDDDELTAYMNAVLGNNDLYYNATILEFDFTPATDSLKFNFIFASNEYGTYQCNFSDAFAFFLTDLDTGDVENLAIVPDTTDPISVVTIRKGIHSPEDWITGEPQCGDVNPEYFYEMYAPNGNFNGQPPITNPINFNGWTVPMTAKSEVVPGKTYRIKMVVQDRGDSGVDSAVFLEGGSFDIGSVDLGGDMLIEELNGVCEDDEVLIDTQLDPDNYTFEWYKDDVLIVGETGPTLIVTETGTYRVEAFYQGNTTCGISDEVLIEIYPIIELDEDLADIPVCVVPGRMPEVDITIHEHIFEKQKMEGATFEYSYHLTENNAENYIDPIVNPQAYVPNEVPVTIYVRVYNALTECVQVFAFDIVRKPLLDFVPHDDIPICVYPDYYSTTDLTQVEQFFRDQTSESIVFGGYYLDQEDAYDLQNAIPSNQVVDYLVDELPTTIYMAILNEATGCYSFTSFDIVSTDTFDPFLMEDIVICDGYLVPELPAGQYYSTQAFGEGDRVTPGTVLREGTHVLYVNVENEIGCVFTHQFNVVVTDCTPQRGVSPNGDGLNDGFDLTDYHLLELTIYNRDGVEVYSHGFGYTNQWEGQSNNGNLLPDGTYYYHFITPTGIKTGYVQLVREVQ